MPNDVLIGIAATLRSNPPQTDLAPARTLFEALVKYLHECGEADVEDMDAMANLSMMTSPAIIGLASGYSNGGPNPPAVRATVERIHDITEELLADFIESGKRHRASTRTH